MNAKIIVFAAAIAASTNVFAERFGRDSVYAEPGPSITVRAAGSAVAGNGRGSVYAQPGPSHGSPVTGPAVAGNGRSSVYALDALRAPATGSMQAAGSKPGRS
jgi:hypothetical protein